MSAKSKVYLCKLAGPFLQDRIFDAARKHMLKNGVMPFPKLYPVPNTGDFIPPQGLEQMYLTKESVNLLIYPRGFDAQDIQLVITPLMLSLQGRHDIGPPYPITSLLKRYGNFKKYLDPSKAEMFMSTEGIVLARVFWRCFEEKPGECDPDE